MFDIYFNTSFNTTADTSAAQRENFENLLLWYLQDQGTSITPDQKTYKEEAFSLMLQFAHDKQSELKELGIDVIPYHQYLPYKDALENTLSQK